MIYTLTFNPAIDYIVRVPSCIAGEVNRTAEEKIFAGGKGINVSLVLNNLGIDNTALGFTAGFTGAQIKSILDELGCRNDFVELGGGFSRINVKIKAGQETEINGRGPDIDGAAVNKLYKKLDKLSEGDMLVLAGSIPDSLPDSTYCDIMQYLEGKKLDIVVDATKELLTSALRYRPFLVKPNNTELGEIFGAQLKTRGEAVPYARKLREMGARNVLVSMAGEGAVLIDENDIEYKFEAPAGKVVNSTGAGDSMVAGFIAGYKKKHDYKHALKLGLAAGSASAFSENLANREEIMRVYKSIDK